MSGAIPQFIKDGKEADFELDGQLDAIDAVIAGTKSALKDRNSFRMEVVGNKVVTEKEQLAAELKSFWLKTAHDEVDAVIPKAVEYGAADLKVMGEAMQALLPKELRTMQLGTEMAISFYLLGKCARLFGAYEKGVAASDDTIHDINVYGRMLQRVRETGQWV